MRNRVSLRRRFLLILELRFKCKLLFFFQLQSKTVQNKSNLCNEVDRERLYGHLFLHKKQDVKMKYNKNTK